MKVLIVTPSLTEIASMEDQLSRIDGFMVMDLVKMNKSVFAEYKDVFFDLTFNFFDPKMTPSFLWKVFLEFHALLQSLDMDQIHLTLIRNYPFSSNRKIWNIMQKMLEQFFQLVVEFYRTNKIYVPNLISREGLIKLNHPILELIQAVRMEKAHRSQVTEASRFYVLYELDFVTCLIEYIEEGVPETFVLEGNEMSLKQMNEKVQVVVGRSPVMFHRTYFVHYHYPDVAGESTNEIHYAFENILVDFVSNLLSI